jgi:hypothetical protein
MTAEKHPLETVQNTLQESARGCSAIELIAPNIKDAREYASMMKAEIDAALTALTLYMSQPQSCAECERLGMENDAMKSTLIAMRELNKRGLVEENKALREAVRDFGAVCGGVDDWGDKLAAVQEKHAATIADAGGES